MSDSKSNTGLKIALVIFILISIGLAGYIVYDKFIDNNDTKEVEKKEDTKKEETKKEEEKKEEEPVKEKEDNKSTFSIDNEAGIAYVEGYATVKHLKNSNDEADYILFNILKTDSKDFMQFIEESKGNLYVGDKAIGLGCKANDTIQYFNSSDEAEEEITLYKLDEETTQKILKATKDSPIKLKLERLEFTGGSEAPLCYSHITHVSIVE